MDLLELFEQLKANKTSASYTVSPVKDMEGVFLGLDKDSRPCIFIASEENFNMPAIKTSEIKVEFSKKYKLMVEGNEEEKLYNSIFCTSDNKKEAKTFITVVESILISLGGKITVQSLNEIFQSLVSLFGIKQEQDVLAARKGLWAELFFMQQNEGFGFWAPLWHSEPTRAFDFSIDSLRTEIKSTVRGERVHDFSHRQLTPVSNERIVVVSYLLQEDDSGMSLQGLIAAAKEGLKGSTYYIRLERAIRSTGMDDGEEPGPKFNAAYAIRHTAWFKSIDIPRFPIEEPSGVSGTHYRSDLSQAPQLDRQNITAWIAELRTAAAI